MKSKLLQVGAAILVALVIWAVLSVVTPAQAQEAPKQGLTFVEKKAWLEPVLNMGRDLLFFDRQAVLPFGGVCYEIDGAPTQACIMQTFTIFTASNDCDTKKKCQDWGKMLCKDHDGHDPEQTQTTPMLDGGDSCSGKCKNGRYWFAICTPSAIMNIPMTIVDEPDPAGRNEGRNTEGPWPASLK